MKILIYSEYFLPNSGGVQTYVFELASGLAEWQREHKDSPALEVIVFTRTLESTAQDKSWPFQLVRSRSLRRLRGLASRAEVVHIAGPALRPMILAALMRKPAVVEHHGYQAVCPNGLLLMGTNSTVCPGHFMAHHYGECARCNSPQIGCLRSIRSLILMSPRRWLLKRMTAHIAITNHVGRRIALPRTRTILYGIRDPGATRLPRDGNEIHIGYVGRLVPEKGLPLLLKAAKRLADDGTRFRLTFVGGGPLREGLENESRELGIAGRVSFTGDLTGDNLERAVRPIDVVVMPSVWEETAGLSAIEQMMRGGVVVAADIGGLSEVVGDAGLKFAAGDSESLYERLRDVINAPAIADSLRASARARALQLFRRDDMIESHLSLYREALHASVGD